MRVGVLTGTYPVEPSPTLKGLVGYVADRGADVEVITARLALEPGLQIGKARIVQVLPRAVPRRIEKLFRPLVHGYERSQLVAAVRARACQWDVLFCAEFPALDAAHRAGYPLERAIYLSLESEAGFRRYPPAYVRSLLGSCGHRVIQSPERARRLNAYLGTSLQFSYLPVALRPRPAPTRTACRATRPLRIVHAGFFAPWAMLTDLLTAFGGLAERPLPELLLQGHSPGTDDYRRAVATQAAGMPTVTVNTAYYGDREHHELLQCHDLGAAFYRTNDRSPNWSDLIFSSGKIAAYLWAGLAVLTNLKCELTGRPPFLVLDRLEAPELDAALRRYRRAPGLYHEAALACARTHYNLDTAMERLCATVLPPQG